MTLSEALVEYQFSGRTKKRETIDRMLAAVGALERTTGKIATLGDLTARNLAAMVEARRSFGSSQNTICGDVRKLLTLAKWAAKRGWCELPDYVGPTPVYEPPTAFTASELELLHQAARTYRGRIGGTPGCLYFSALLAVLYDTGERFGAVVALEWPAVQNGRLHFAAITRKGGSVGRTVRVRPETIDALGRLREWNDVGPFCGPCKGTIHAHWRRVVEAAGLKPDRKLGTHAVRRSVASLLKAGGYDAAAALGHASEATTRAHYYDPRITEADAVCDQLPKLGVRKRWWWPW